MELWLKGAFLLLQSGAATVLSVWAHRNRRLRSLAVGAATGLVLCGWLPEALHQSSTLILAPATVLGVILSIFLRESVTLPRYKDILWGGWLMLYAYLQAEGVPAGSCLSYLLPVGIALTDGRLRLSALLTALPMCLGWVVGCITEIPAKWNGLLLSLGCGMLLQGLGDSDKENFAGGIVIGLILSFI